MKIKLDEFEQSVLILPFCGWFIWVGYRGTIELFNLIQKLINRLQSLESGSGKQ